MKTTLITVLKRGFLKGYIIEFGKLFEFIILVQIEVCSLTIYFTGAALMQDLPTLHISG